MKDFFSRYQNYILFTGVFLLAFFLKFPFLGDRDLAIDEPFTLFHSQGSFLDILKLPSQKEPHPPLFMILVHLWNKVANYDVETLRLLPLIFHALTAPIVFFTGKRFFGLLTGILALVMFCFSNQFFYFAQELRGYGLFSLLTSGVLYFFLSCTEKTTRWSMIGLLICNILLVYNHYFGWFVIGVQGICSLFFIRDKRLFVKLLVVMAVTALAFIPMWFILLDQFGHSSQGGWVKAPIPEDFKIQLSILLNDGRFRNFGLFNLGKLFLIIAVPLALIRGNLFRKNRKLWMVFIWWLVPYALMFFISDKVPMFIDRYVLFNAIGLYVFLAASIERLVHIKWLKITLGVILIASMLTGLNENKEYCVREHKKAISFIKEHQDEKTIVGVFPPWVKLHFSFHYDLESFKQKENLVPALEEKNVIVSWGPSEYFWLADEISADKVILFTNNGFPADTELIEKLQNRFPNRENHKFEENVEVIILSK